MGYDIVGIYYSYKQQIKKTNKTKCNTRFVYVSNNKIFLGALMLIDYSKTCGEVGRCTDMQAQDGSHISMQEVLACNSQ